MLTRVLSALLAIALLLASLLAIAEITLAALGRPAWLVPYDQWNTWLSGHTFTTLAVRIVLVGAAVLGLLLLLAALRRGKPSAVELPARTDGVRVTASRRGVESSLASAARRVDGVHSARARAGRRSVRVTAVTALREPGDLSERTAAQVSDQLLELGLDDTLRPRVSLSQESTR